MCAAAPQKQRSHSLCAAAGAWGLLRNIFQEVSNLRFAGHDTHPAALGSCALPAAADAFGSAYSGSTLATPRMLPVLRPCMAEGASEVPAGGSMLITGGLGGLGILFARQAALQGASRCAA